MSDIARNLKLGAYSIAAVAGALVLLTLASQSAEAQVTLVGTNSCAGPDTITTGEYVKNVTCIKLEPSAPPANWNTSSLWNISAVGLNNDARDQALNASDIDQIVVTFEVNNNSFSGTGNSVNVRRATWVINGTGQGASGGLFAGFNFTSPMLWANITNSSTDAVTNNFSMTGNETTWINVSLRIKLSGNGSTCSDTSGLADVACPAVNKLLKLNATIWYSGNGAGTTYDNRLTLFVNDSNATWINPSAPNATTLSGITLGAFQNKTNWRTGVGYGSMGRLNGARTGDVIDLNVTLPIVDGTMISAVHANVSNISAAAGGVVQFTQVGSQQYWTARVTADKVGLGNGTHLLAINVTGVNSSQFIGGTVLLPVRIDNVGPNATDVAVATTFDGSATSCNAGCKISRPGGNSSVYVEVTVSDSNLTDSGVANVTLWYRFAEDPQYRTGVAPGGTLGREFGFQVFNTSCCVSGASNAMGNFTNSTTTNDAYSGAKAGSWLRASASQTSADAADDGQFINESAPGGGFVTKYRFYFNFSDQLANGTGYYEFWGNVTDMAGNWQLEPQSEESGFRSRVGRVLIENASTFDVSLTSGSTTKTSGWDTGAHKVSGLTVTVDLNTTWDVTVTNPLANKVSSSTGVCIVKPGNVSSDSTCKNGAGSASVTIPAFKFDLVGLWWIRDNISSDAEGRDHLLYINVTPTTVTATSPPGLTYSKTLQPNVELNWTYLATGLAAANVTSELWLPGANPETAVLAHRETFNNSTVGGNSKFLSVGVQSRGAGVYNITGVINGRTTEPYFSLTADAKGSTTWTVSSRAPTLVIANNNATVGFSSGDVTVNGTAEDGKSLLGSVSSLGASHTADYFNVSITDSAGALVYWTNQTRITDTCSGVGSGPSSARMWVNVTCSGFNITVTASNGTWPSGTFTMKVQADTTPGIRNFDWEYDGTIAFTTNPATPGVVVRRGGATGTVIWDTRTCTAVTTTGSCTAEIVSIGPPPIPGTATLSPGPVNLTFEFIGKNEGENGGPADIVNNLTLSPCQVQSSCRGNATGANVTLTGDVVWTHDGFTQSTNRCGHKFGWSAVWGDICAGPSDLGYDATNRMYYVNSFPSKAGGTVTARLRWSSGGTTSNITDFDKTVTVTIKVADQNGELTVNKSTIETGKDEVIGITWKTPSGSSVTNGEVTVSAYRQDGQRVFVGSTDFTGKDYFNVSGNISVNDTAVSRGLTLRVNATSTLVNRVLLLNASGRTATGEVYHAIAKITVVAGHSLTTTLNNSSTAVTTAGVRTKYWFNTTNAAGGKVDTNLWLLTRTEIQNVLLNASEPTTLSDTDFERFIANGTTGNDADGSVKRVSQGTYQKTIRLLADAGGIYYVYARTVDKTQDNANSVLTTTVTVTNATTTYVPTTVPDRIVTNTTVNVTVTDINGVRLNGTLAFTTFVASDVRATIWQFGTTTNATSFTVTNGWIGQGLNITGRTVGDINVTFTPTGGVVTGTDKFTVKGPNVTASPSEIGAGRLTEITIVTRIGDQLLEGLNVSAHCPGATSNGTTNTLGQVKISVFPTGSGQCTINVNGTATDTRIIVRAGALKLAASSTTPEVDSTVTVSVQEQDGSAFTGTASVKITKPDGTTSTVETTSATQGQASIVVNQLGDWFIDATAPDRAPPSTLKLAVGAKKAAQFEWSGLSVTPTSVEVGKTITARATVTNIGNAQGQTLAALKVGTTAVDTKGPLTLDQGQSVQVTFTYTPTSVGTIQVTIDDLNPTTVTVTEPVVAEAVLDYVSFTLSSASIEAGQSVTVNCKVKNVGNKADTLGAEFKVGGNVVGTELVRLAVNEEKTVSRILTGLAVATHQVACGDLAAQNVEVKAVAVPPPKVPGFEPLLALAAVGAVLAVLRRRKQ